VRRRCLAATAEGHGLKMNDTPQESAPKCSCGRSLSLASERKRGACVHCFIERVKVSEEERRLRRKRGASLNRPAS
jgi:hypothetical protein